jgi:putative ABC transport system permease protein
VSTYGHRAGYEIVGTASYGDVDSLGFASMAIWDLDTAKRLLHREDRYDGISIAAKKGTTPAELVRAVRPLLPDNLQVKDAQKQADEDAENLNQGLSFIRYFLLGFGGIALLVGAFVIFNTLSITVAQRTREFATLRTLGGSRKQVMRSVILEGLVIGLLASAIGLVLGLGIAQGLVAAFKALGVELPKASMVVASSTIEAALFVGTGTTLLASILPARRSTRVPPIAAVREGSILPPSRLAGHSRKAGIGIVAAAVAAMAAGSFGDLAAGPKALLLVSGVLGLFVGIAFLASHAVKPPFATRAAPPRRRPR